MDNRTIQAVLLSLLIWYGWLLLFPPEPPAEADPDVATDVVPAADPVATAAVPSEPAAGVPEAPVRTEPVNFCRSEATLTTRDGALRSMDLLDHEASYEVQAGWQYVWGLINGTVSGPWKPYGDLPPPQEEVLSPDALGLTVGAGSLTARAPRVEIVTSGAEEVVTRGVSPEGIEVTRRLSASSTDPCVTLVEVTWRNTGSTAFNGGLWLGLHDVLPESTGRYAAAVRPRVFVDGSVDYRDDLTDIVEPEILEGEVGWFALADAYFGAFLVPGEGSTGAAAFSAVALDDGRLAHGLHYVRSDSLLPGAAVSETFRLYAGPKDSALLAAVDPSLESAVELGYLSMLAWPLLWFLKLIHGVVGNWGLSIVLLTFLVKGLFFPLTQKSFQSSQAMQALQPKMAALKEEFADNPEEMNRRTMQLFQEHGVNPLGGCLPMLVQMPVWIALYSVLLSAVELYHTEFLYLKDLSVPDPYMILPAIVVVLMVLQQQFVPTGNMDPTQARMMKIMPLMFGFFFFTFPGGLVVYIFINMVLSILQQWYIKRTFQGSPPAAATQGA